MAGPAPQRQVVSDRECELALSRRSRGSGSGIRTRIGRKLCGGSALSQVTGLALIRLKIVRVFEFMPLNCAPGRIRTCAHGSGGRSCSPKLPAETHLARRVGERMGVRWFTCSPTSAMTAAGPLARSIHRHLTYRHPPSNRINIASADVRIRVQRGWATSR